MQPQDDGPVSPLWPLGPQFPGAERASLRLACCARIARFSCSALSPAAGKSREAVLSVMGRQGLRCLRSSCRAGRAAANARVTTAEMRRAPLPPGLPNLRHVGFGSLYSWDQYDTEDQALAKSGALAAAVAALPDSVVSIELDADALPPLLAALGARRGLQSLEYANWGEACEDVLGAVVCGPSRTSLTSLKLKVQNEWDPPPSLLQRVPWQQLQVGRAPAAGTHTPAGPRRAQPCMRPRPRF
jgi:hypothetical protein